MRKSHTEEKSSKSKARGYNMDGIIRTLELSNPAGGYSRGLISWIPLNEMEDVMK